MHSQNRHPPSPSALGKELAWLFLFAWLHLLQRLGRNVKVFFSSLSLFQILFLVSSLCVMAFASPHWLSYSIHFETSQVSTVYTLGSDLRIFCFLTGIIGILFLFFQIPYGLSLYYVYAGGIAVVFVLGFFFPNAIHANFKDAADLHFRLPWMLAWAGAMAMALATAFGALQSPLLDLAKIRAWLLAPKPAARKNSA